MYTYTYIRTCMHACMPLNRACSGTPASGACSRTINMCVCIHGYIYIYIMYIYICIYMNGCRSSYLHTYKLHTVYIHAYRIYMDVLTHTRTLKLCVPCSRTTPLTHARTRTLSAWAALAPACSTARRRDTSPKRAQSSKSAFLLSSVMTVCSTNSANTAFTSSVLASSRGVLPR